MASIRKKPNGTFEIRFVDHTNSRKSLYVRNITKREAESIASKVEHIVGRKLQGSEPDREVSEWVGKLAEPFHTKLVRLGLVVARQVVEPEVAPEPVRAPTIKDWTDRYVEKHSGKAGTVEQLEITARSLCHFLGADRCIDDVTAGDAEDFRKWLQTKGNERKKHSCGLADNTVRRRIGRSKQFFNAAVKHELIPRNPFAGEASAVGGNEERMSLVPADWIERCIRVAPCEDWRIILAFARYGGMRSHETRIQRWGDIDLANNRMIIRSNKTPPVRSCPIFPELRPHLLRAREMAPSGAEFVQNRYGHDDNILTTLQKIITKAGLVPWPRLMQNLRATRETELLAHYPDKDVTSWLGNSPQVANRHDAMTMQTSFDQAVLRGAAIPGVTSKVPQNIPQSAQDKGGINETEETEELQNPVNNWVCLIQSLNDLPLSCPTRT